MKINFGSLCFEVRDEKIRLSSFGNIAFPSDMPFVEVQVAGENKDTHLGIKLTNSSEGKRLRYVSHELCEDMLEIVQKSELIGVKTVFSLHGASRAVKIHSEITNISTEKIIIEEASSFVLTGIGRCGIDSSSELFFTRFKQSHHAECQPQRRSFRESGLYRANSESQKRIAFANIGSWSTKEELPQGIIEDAENRAIAFAIESSSSWYYEIADNRGKYYLWLGGASLPFGDLEKELDTGATYRTVSIVLTDGTSAEDAIGELTKYRRKTVKRSPSDLKLPTIFNEYMHLSWDSPTEENTRRVAPTVASLGIDYYVIDCGWHNEEPGCEVYPYVGQWKESHARFPSGLRKTTDYIRSLGMKPGLWIEPEIIGIKCTDMLAYYDDDCFLSRNGKKIAVMGRYFLDYRNARVREYMSESIRRMVEDYGADYIKFDYNEDIGIGTDKDAKSRGEGLEDATRAFFSWVSEMTERYPEVIFEGCASGGMRMDGSSLSHFSLVSTSDQIDYTKYPYIAANILSAAIPEQAAVWSYPVTKDGAGISVFSESAEWVAENITDKKIAVNMINSFLGRMHLASHLELMNEHQLDLVREGVKYYDSIRDAKTKAIPIFPLGYASFGDGNCVGGFKADGVTYLAVWHLHGATRVTIPLENEIANAEIGYPKKSQINYTVNSRELTVDFGCEPEAVFFEIKEKNL